MLGASTNYFDNVSAAIQGDGSRITGILPANVATGGNIITQGNSFSVTFSNNVAIDGSHQLSATNPIFAGTAAKWYSPIQDYSAAIGQGVLAIAADSIIQAKTSIPNAWLANSSITIQGVSVSLGGSTMAATSVPTWGGELFTTNASNFPDFSFGYSMTNVGASYTLGAPINQTAGKTKVETTVFIIKTNGIGSSPWTLTSPAGVTTTGTAFVTNVTVVTVWVYGNVVTNYNYFPVN